MAARLALVCVLALVAFGCSTPGSSASEIKCSSTEQNTYHIHAELMIFVNGQQVTVPANIGIEQDCLYWLHTHDTSGIIHVEAPKKDTYTLGQFFEIWGEPLDSTHLLDKTATDNQSIIAYVNGQKYQGDPQDIPIKPREVIVLEYGPPFVPAPPFQFPEGL